MSEYSNKFTKKQRRRERRKTQPGVDKDCCGKCIVDSAVVLSDKVRYCGGKIVDCAKMCAPSNKVHPVETGNAKTGGKTRKRKRRKRKSLKKKGGKRRRTRSKKGGLLLLGAYAAYKMFTSKKNRKRKRAKRKRSYKRKR